MREIHKTANIEARQEELKDWVINAMEIVNKRRRLTCSTSDDISEVAGPDLDRSFVIRSVEET